MSDSRKAATIVAGFLTALAFCGLACNPPRQQEENVPTAFQATQTKLDDYLKHNPGAIKSATDYIDAGIADNFAVMSAKNEPIKVRGGSMTAFTSLAKWIPVSDTYCVNVMDPSVIRIENLLDQHGDPAVQPTALLAGWNMVILGHEGKDVSGGQHGGTGTNPSNYGISFLSQATFCDGTTTASSFSIVMGLVNPNNNPYVGFYKDILPPAKPWLDSRRFKDGSQGYDPSDTGGDGKKDGEYRERMYLVTITPNHAQGGSPVSYTCPDGECTIYMGKPQLPK